MEDLALRFLQEETEGFELQSRLRDDIIDAMIRFKNETQNIEKSTTKALSKTNVRRSFSKTYPKGLEITDDSLIFIKDTLQQMTIENKNGYREFKAKVRITFNYA